MTGTYSKKCVFARRMPDETRASGAMLPSKNALHSVLSKRRSESGTKESAFTRSAKARCINGVGIKLGYTLLVRCEMISSKPESNAPGASDQMQNCKFCRACNTHCFRRIIASANVPPDGVEFFRAVAPNPNVRILDDRF